MNLSYSSHPQEVVGYYPLKNDKVDVFLRKNERIEADEEGNVLYVSEEKHLQVEQSTSKRRITDNFDEYWNAYRLNADEPNDKERIEALEDALLQIIMGGGM